MKKLSYKMLYIVWAILFALTAVLGFLFPDAEGAPARIALLVTAAVFFLPPWLILRKSRKEEKRFHRWLVGFLSMASIVLTVVLLVANFLSVGGSAQLGRILNSFLILVSAPMLICFNWAVSLFLWACLLMVTIPGFVYPRKKKEK